ncbi:MAG: DNA-3-methyladenine glycosylase I [Rhodospirillaceae bacterium]
MRTFDEIEAIARERKGDLTPYLESHGKAMMPAKLAKVLDDRWLAMMTRCVFQAGFNWKVVGAMWDGFEAAFDGFDVGRCSMLNDDDIARLVSDKRIIRNGQKIGTVPANAVFVAELAAEHGGAGAFFGGWPANDYVGLLDVLKKRGARLGGNTGAYFLRFMHVDSFILSKDVTARLVAEGVVDKTPGSAKAMAAVQAAFNDWRAQSGRSLTEISRILALSIG